MGRLHLQRFSNKRFVVESFRLKTIICGLVFYNANRKYLMNNVVVVIPARYGSTRLPGKPLLEIAGKPLVVWVAERAAMTFVRDQIFVATDDERVMKVVHDYGFQAKMTSSSHASGSDRVAEVIKGMDCKIVVNLQGDEPLIDIGSVKRAVDLLKSNGNVQVATLGCPMTDEQQYRNPNVVKALTDEKSRVVYFSRSPIPYFREAAFRPLPFLFQHIGVYIYRKDFLLKFIAWEPSPPEIVESLEQLRIIYHGFPIHLIATDRPSYGVDAAQDIAKIESLLKKREKLEKANS
jgi:3-deoxy-manno-octulosonate cytidylyltransferase (CMP-KDO synthetase)